MCYQCVYPPNGSWSIIRLMPTYFAVIRSIITTAIRNPPIIYTFLRFTDLFYATPLSYEETMVGCPMIQKSCVTIVAQLRTGYPRTLSYIWIFPTEVLPFISFLMS